jgi:hypothetical protein
LNVGILQLLHQSLDAIIQAILPLLAGIGLGMLFHAPYQVFLCSLPPQDLATGTGAFFLVRFTGATVGLVSHLCVLNCGFHEKNRRDRPRVDINPIRLFRALSLLPWPAQTVASYSLISHRLPLSDPQLQFEYVDLQDFFAFMETE